MVIIVKMVIIVNMVIMVTVVIVGTVVIIMVIMVKISPASTKETLNLLVTLATRTP